MSMSGLGSALELVTASTDGTLCQWDVTRLNEPTNISTLTTPPLSAQVRDKVNSVLCGVLCWIELYCIVVNWTVLYCIVLYCIVLFCLILHFYFVNLPLDNYSFDNNCYHKLYQLFIWHSVYFFYHLFSFCIISIIYNHFYYRILLLHFAGVIFLFDFW